MKTVFGIMGLAAALLAAGCFDQTGGTRSYKGPLFRYHSANRAQLAPGTNAAVLKEIAALPASADLRAHVAQKLAAATLPFWRAHLPADATDQTALLRPLLDDFLSAEAFMEVRGAVGSADTTLAVELSDARAQIWSDNLKKVAAAWKLGTPRDLTAEGFKGWETKRAQAPNTLQFFRAGKWVVVGLGHERLTQVPALLAELKKAGRPLPALNNSFMDLAADLPGLRPWFPALAKWPLPPIVANLAGRGDTVRTEVRFQYSARIPWRPEPWKIPTNLVSEPLTSFTLGQGIAPLLGEVKELAASGLKPLPNQFCAWGINHQQCRMYFTVPVASAPNAVKHMSTAVPKLLYSTLPSPLGSFLYSTNKADEAEILWAGVPYLIPMLRPHKNGRDEYLFGCLFPPEGKHTPVPDELFAQVRGRTNLVYYDWEITEHRLTHGRQFFQLAAILNGRAPPSTNSPSQRWLSAIGPRLGNSATEITQTGPQELALVRRSHVGFTGFELAALSIWLESPGFPFNFQLPLTKVRPGTNSTPARPGAPAARGSNTPARAASPAPPPKR
jgi:hypothetical protein